MSVADLHPEDLIERDATGRLTEAERIRLLSHLARCATCRLERQLRVDFADDLQTEEVPEALVGLSARQGKLSAPVPYRRHRWSLPRARTAWLLAAATLLIGGVAASATGVTRRIWSPQVEPVSAEFPAVSEAKKAKTAQARVSRHAETPVQPAPVDEAKAQPVESAPVVTAAPLPRAIPEPVAMRPALRPSETGPADLLAAEGDARRQGDYERVVSLHRQLLSRYAGSREAQVSRATVGRLLLDRGNPADALTSFDAYLGAGAGSLEEEALVGRATALERLGRRDEAARAWGDVLAAFPQGPYATHARTRLGGVSGN